MLLPITSQKIPQHTSRFHNYGQSQKFQSHMDSGYIRFQSPFPEQFVFAAMSRSFCWYNFEFRGIQSCPRNHSADCNRNDFSSCPLVPGTYITVKADCLQASKWKKRVRGDTFCTQESNMHQPRFSLDFASWLPTIFQSWEKYLLPMSLDSNIL